MASSQKKSETCVVLVPFSGSIVPHCENGLQQLESLGFEVRRIAGYAAIDYARSEMATEALADGFDELMWIDSDIGFKADDFLQLQSLNLPISCGIYVKKAQRALSCHLLPGTDQITFGEGGGIQEILYAATGFLFTKRVVYEKIQTELSLPTCNLQFNRPHIPFFQPMVVQHDKTPWSLAEDFSFSERVRIAGYRIMADTRIRLWHYGLFGYSWEDAGSPPKRYATYHYNVPNQRPE